jgi:hypothetical protein
MLNPQEAVFYYNICSSNERFDLGFEAITYTECGLLGLDFVNLLLDNFSNRKDCCKIEQACQNQIDCLVLGTQRLHRNPGAGMSHSIGGGGRMIVGATYLPPDFFQNNLNIVIVGSRYNRR